MVRACLHIRVLQIGYGIVLSLNVVGRFGLHNDLQFNKPERYDICQRRHEARRRHVGDGPVSLYYFFFYFIFWKYFLSKIIDVTLVSSRG